MPVIARSTRARRWRKNLRKEWFDHFWYKVAYPIVQMKRWSNIQGLSRNPNVSFEFIKANLDLGWDWAGVSANPNVTMEIIEAHPEFPWDYHDGVSSNPNLTIEFVNERMDYPWRWDGVSACPNMTLGIIEDNPIFLWTWYFGISRNPNITIEFIKKHRDKDWNWHFVSQAKNIYPQDVEDHPLMSWEWDGLSYNPNITVDFLKRHLDKPWNWFMLSCHPNITLDMIDAIRITNEYGVRIDPWIAHGLSGNPNISLQTMLERTDVLWRWNSVAGNTNLTFEDSEFLCRNKNVSREGYVCGLNTFDREKTSFIAKKAREHMAAYRIQQCWFRTVTNPYCDIGARSLLKSYNKLVSPENMHPDYLLEPSHYGMAPSV